MASKMFDDETDTKKSNMFDQERHNDMDHYFCKTSGSFSELPKLKRWEKFACTAVTTACLSMMFYSVYQTSKVLEKNLEEYRLLGDFGLTKKRGILNRIKDDSDYEWEIYILFYKSILMSYIGHTLTSLFFTKMCPKYRRHMWVVSGVSAITWVLGWQTTIICWAVCSLVYIIIFAKSMMLIWMFGLAFLYGISHPTYRLQVVMKKVFNYNISVDDEILLVGSICFRLVSLISFAVEKIKRLKGNSDLCQTITFTYFDILVYMFYTPNFWMGPPLIYKYFQPEVMKPNTGSHIKFSQAFRIFIQSFLVMILREIFGHLFYVYALAFNTYALDEISLWSLGGLFCIINIFHLLKYSVLFGFPASFTMLDNIQPPKNPPCPVRVTYMSIYWRCGDHGLYLFLKHYIYLPFCKLKVGFVFKYFAKMGPFLFISRWHGATPNIVWWTSLSYVAVSIEGLAADFVRLPSIAHYEDRYFGPTWTRRFHALLNVPLYYFSGTILMLYHSGIKATLALPRRFYNEGTALTWMITIAFGYATTVYSQEVGMREYKMRSKRQNKIYNEAN